MLLGDGKLNYGSERIFGSYYLIQLGRYLQLSPGFNQGRGPVKVFGLRLRLNY